MKAIWVFFVLIFLILTGCKENVTDINLPRIDYKYVVICFISPLDSIITLSLTKTAPANSTDTLSKIIGDATVEISSGSQKATLVFNADKRRYQADTLDLQIARGRTYNLLIVTKEGQLLRSNCTVPDQQVQFLSYKTTPISFSEVYYQVRLSNNNPNPLYCCLQVCNKEKLQNPLDTFYLPLYNDIRYITEQSTDISLKGHYATNYFPFLMDLFVDDPFGIKLLVCDRDYYEYHKSLQMNSNPSSYQNIPMYYYSNIEGGLGIFASYCTQ